MNGYDLERHTRLNKMSNGWKCISEKKPSPGVKITACRDQKQVCVKPHIWGNVQKKFCFFEGSQNHVFSVTLNGRILKQPGLFLELASLPNWGIDGEGPWLVWSEPILPIRSICKLHRAPETLCSLALNKVLILVSFWIWPAAMKTWMII